MTEKHDPQCQSQQQIRSFNPPHELDDFEYFLIELSQRYDLQIKC